MASLIRHIAVPLFVVIERNVIKDLPSILARHHLRFESFGVLCGPGPTSGYAKQLVQALGGQFSVTQLCVGDNDTEEVDRVVQWLAGNPVNVIIAIGGGRVLDVAKAACIMRNQPLILAPTSISSDSIASPIAVIKQAGRSRSIPGQPPLGIVVDLATMCDSPPRLLLAGVGDLISNISAAYDWRLARDHHREPHDAATEAMARIPAERMLHRTFESRRELHHDEQFLRDLAEGLVLSGIAMGIAASSRPCSGSEHMISHALDQLRPGIARHGEQVIVATYFTLSLQEQHELCESLQKLAQTIGLPHHPDDLGIDRDLFFRAVRSAPSTRPGRFSILDIKRTDTELDRAFVQAFESSHVSTTRI